MKKFFLAAALACSGCASTDTSGEIYIAPSAQHYTEEILNAAEALNQQVGAEAYTVTITDSEEWRDEAIVIRGVKELANKRREATSARTYRRGHGILIELSTASNMPFLIAHELTHAAGLKHTKDPDNLLFRAPSTYALTPSQIEEIRIGTGVVP